MNHKYFFGRGVDKRNKRYKIFSLLGLMNFGFIFLMLISFLFIILFSISGVVGQTCTDSDDGKNYYLKGSVTKGDRSESDTCRIINSNINYYDLGDCSGNNCYVLEWICAEDNDFQSSVWKCPQGCQDGVCICETIGEAVAGKFCDVDMKWKDLKAEGVTCLNNYECIIDSCVDGICQEKFASIAERGSWLDKIWAKIQGYQCVPGDEGCDGTDYLLCGAEGVWENKGKVNGKCGYSGPGNGGGGGGGGRCVPKWVCGNWSNYVVEFDTKCGSRECRDVNNCGTNAGKPAIYLACPGSVSANSYCGDGKCDSDETPYNCAQDCPHYCGDSVCNNDESSYSCPEDCEPEPRTNYIWLFILLIIILLSAIGFVGFKLYRTLKKKKGAGSGGVVKPSGPVRPTSMGQPGNVMRKPLGRSVQSGSPNIGGPPRSVGTPPRDVGKNIGNI